MGGGERCSDSVGILSTLPGCGLGGAGAAAVSGPLKKKASEESLDSLFLTVKMFDLGLLVKLQGSLNLVRLFSSAFIMLPKVSMTST